MENKAHVSSLTQMKEDNPTKLLTLSNRNPDLILGKIGVVAGTGAMTEPGWDSLPDTRGSRASAPSTCRLLAVTCFRSMRNENLGIDDSMPMAIGLTLHMSI